MLAPVFTLLVSLLGFGRVVTSDGSSNAPSSEETWCGEAYHASDSSFEPGGRLELPRPTTPDQPRLSLNVYSRYSYYTSNDKTATLIVDTPVTNYSGTPYDNSTYDPITSPTKKIPLTELSLYIGRGEKEILVKWVRVPVNASGTVIDIRLDGLNISGQSVLHFAVIASSPDGIQTFHSTLTLTILPEYDLQIATGSMTRVDRLYGSIATRSHVTHWKWQPFFPVGFSVDWNWVANVVLDERNGRNTLYHEYLLGNNIIHPIFPEDPKDFDPMVFDRFLTICDYLPLYVVLDLRHTYRDIEELEKQVDLWKRHTSVLVYYTAHEPDGHSEAPEAIIAAYRGISSLDPYRPIILTLNCANFHFPEYIAGANIVIENTRTTVTNSSYSALYGAECNATNGRCGYDEGRVNNTAYPEYVLNPFKDVSDRLDSYYTYQNWMQSPPQIFNRPVWSAPQVFPVEDDGFWSRQPSAKEEALLWLLRVDHGSMGLIADKWPTDPALANVTTQLGMVLTRSGVTTLLATAPRSRLPASIDSAAYDPHLFDFAIWVGEEEVLIVLLYLGARRLTVGRIRAELPVDVEALEILWGYEGWSIETDSHSLVSGDTGSMDASVLKAKIVGARV